MEDWHFPGAHLFPLLMALLMAAVSSVTPSPGTRSVFGWFWRQILGAGHTFGTKVLHIAKDLVTTRAGIKRCNALMFDVFHPESDTGRRLRSMLWFLGNLIVRAFVFDILVEFAQHVLDILLDLGGFTAMLGKRHHHHEGQEGKESSKTTHTVGS